MVLFHVVRYVRTFLSISFKYDVLMHTVFFDRLVEPVRQKRNRLLTKGAVFGL